MTLTDFQFVRQRLIVDDVHSPLGRDHLLQGVHVDQAALVAATGVGHDAVRHGVGVVEVHEDTCKTNSIVKVLSHGASRPENDNDE